MGQKLFENTDLAGAHCSWAYRLLFPQFPAPLGGHRPPLTSVQAPHQPALPASQESHPKDDRKSPHNLYATIRMRGQQENCGPPYPPTHCTLHSWDPAGAKPLSPPSTKHGIPPKQAAGATAWLTGSPHVSYCKDFEIQTMRKLETNKCSQLF